MGKVIGVVFVLLIAGVLIVLGVIHYKIRAFAKKYDMGTSDSPTVHHQGINDVEYRYSIRGKYDVVQMLQRNDMREYSIYYPVPLEEVYPVIVWANGTGQTYDDFEETLKCLASHGFVVIGNDDKNTGGGQSVYEMALYVEKLNMDKDNPLVGHLDLEHMGVGGHSQGGCGAVNAATRFERSVELFKSLFTSSMPQIGLCHDTEVLKFAYWKYDITQIKIPYLMTVGDGKYDNEVVCPLETVKENYNSLSAEVPAVMAVKKGANHNIVTKKYGSGIMNAWFSFTLKGDKIAASVFTGTEIRNNTEAWINVRSQNLEVLSGKE